jgi:hypothetical protein
MVEAAEIPVVNKTMQHRTTRNSTYTSNTNAVDAGYASQPDESFTCVQANETQTSGQSFAAACEARR